MRDHNNTQVNKSYRHSQCPLCSSQKLEADRTIHSNYGPNTDIDYMVCLDCGTIFADNLDPIDYMEDDSAIYSGENSVRMYLELEAGYNFFARALILLKRFGAENSEKFLDIGGGFGLVSHMAKLVYDWNVTSIDPSERCELGGQALGISYLRECFDNRTFPDNTFDVILCSEVIEHIPHSDEFITTIKNKLKNGGIALFTTPNADVVSLRNCTEIEWAESYAFGAHCLIFSSKSVRTVLKRNGFSDLLTCTSEGSSGKKRHMVVGVSGKPARSHHDMMVDDSEIECLLLQYFKKALAEKTRNHWHSVFKESIKVRLFEILVNKGEYSRALYIVKAYADKLEAMGLNPTREGWTVNAEDWCSYLDSYPSFLGKYYFYRGMIALNGEGDIQRAYIYFFAAYKTLLVMYNVGFLAMEGFIGSAALHVIICLVRVGKTFEAKSYAREVLELSFLSQKSRDRIHEELNKMGNHEEPLVGEFMPKGGNYMESITFGNMYEYYETLVNDGKYDPASKISDAIDSFLTAKQIIPNHIGDLEYTRNLTEAFPQLGKYLYFRGMHTLNTGSDLALAAEYFSAALKILKAQAVDGFSVENDFIGLAILHQILSLRYAGKLDDARALVDKAVSDQDIPHSVMERIKQEQQLLQGK